MNLRQSLSFPELLVGSDGSVYKNGQRLPLNYNHGTTIRGPVVTYLHNGKGKQVSVIRLVFEAHVKKAKIEPADYVEFIDGNELNVKADNLVKGRRYSKLPVKKVKKEKQKREEEYSTWLNGHCEVYC
jgi:hypothetical protein